jgi:hypothetical protein
MNAQRVDLTEREEKRDPGATAATYGVASLFGQILLIPFRSFLYGMELLLDAMRGLQHAGDGGVKLIVGDGVARVQPAEIAPQPGTNVDSAAASGSGLEIASQENKHMDKDLNDDQLKLVRYKILFVKRDFEHAFPEQEELVSDNMDGSAFTAWKVAQFIQSLRDESGSHVHVPKKWHGYPDDKDGSGRYLYRDGNRLTGLPEDDKKYLRVFFEVLERYPREKLKYEEDQLHVLREIKDAIREKKSGDGRGVNVS